MALGGQFEGQNGVQVALGGQLGGPSGVQMEPKLRGRAKKSFSVLSVRRRSEAPWQYIGVDISYDHIFEKIDKKCPKNNRKSWI